MSLRRALALGISTSLMLLAIPASPASAVVGPNCTMIAPSAQIVSGTQALFAATSDPAGTSLEFFIANRFTGTGHVSVGQAHAGLGWNLSWNSTTKPDGFYQASCIAKDSAGNPGLESAATPFGVHNTLGTPLPPPSSSSRGAAMGFAQPYPHPFNPLGAEIDAIATQGTGWVRTGENWNKVTQGLANPQNKSTWNFLNNPDGDTAAFAPLATRAHTDGLKVLAVAMGSPAYANASNADGNYYPADAFLNDNGAAGGWGSYIRGLIDNGADAIEVWNEPNSHDFIQPNIDAAKQAELQRFTYDTVKAYVATLRVTNPGQPDIPVITGGLAALGWPGIPGQPGYVDSNSNYCNDTSATAYPDNPINYFVGMRNATPSFYGSRKVFDGSYDAIGFHPYTDDPTATGANGCFNALDHLNQMYATAAFVGDPKPFWFTEFGYSNSTWAAGAINTKYIDYYNKLNSLRTAGIPIANNFAFEIHSDDVNRGDETYGVFLTNWTQQPAAVTIRFEAAQARDVTAPTILSSPPITASQNAPEATTETVTWSTNEVGSAAVEYGKTTTYGSVAGSAGTAFTTAHSVVVTGLSPATAYHYRVRTIDAWGNVAVSGDHTFTTSAGVTKKQTGGTTATTPAFSTTSAERLVALVSTSVSAVSTVTGGGLTWTRVRRSSNFVGSAEIWTATASGPLTGATVTSTIGAAGDQMLTLIAIPPASPFSPVPSVGVNGIANGNSTTAQLSLTTTRAGSLFLAVGHDPTGSLTHTVAAPQVRVDQWLDTGANDTMWLQGLVPTTAGAVTLQATTTAAHQWDFAGAEIYSP